MRKTTYRMGIAVGLACCMTCGLLAGCSSNEPQAQSDETPVIEEAPAYELTIGEDADGALPLIIENDTGKAVTAVSVSLVGTEGDSTSLKMSEKQWAAGQTAGLFLQAAQGTGNAAESSSSAADAGDVVLNEAYDVTLTLEGDMVYTLHQVVPSTLGNVTDTAVHVDEEGAVAYLTYKEGDAEVSTHESELQVAAEAQLAAEKEAQAAAEAENAAALQAEAERQAAAQGNASNIGANGGTSTGGGYDTVGNSGGNTSQGEDSCVDDLILN